jgi:plastocyanin
MVSGRQSFQVHFTVSKRRPMNCARLNPDGVRNVLNDMTPLVRVAAVATAGLILAACGSHSSSATSPAASSTNTSTTSSAPSASAGAQITISSFTFKTPATVTPGEQLTVSNSDSVEHTVTSDDGNSFNGSVVANGTATLTAPSTPGTYPFHCSIHPQMHGTLVVKP